MPKRASLLVAGVALVVGALLLTDWLLWQPGLTEGNVRRIKPGMTLAEVEALLGGPPAEAVEMPADWPAYRWQREWRAEGASLDIQFTTDEMAIVASGGGAAPVGESATLALLAGLVISRQPREERI